MLVAKVNGYECRSTDNYELVYDFLECITIDDNKSMEQIKQRKLKQAIKGCENLVCWKDNKIIGACVYRHAIYGIELIHMYVAPEYRLSYGCGLINYYLINVLGENKDIRLTSSDVSTFDRVVEEFGKLGQYRITDRARVGLAKMLGNKVSWTNV